MKPDLHSLGELARALTAPLPYRIDWPCTPTAEEFALAERIGYESDVA